MVTQEMVEGVPCERDKRGHLLNCGKQCQWCHMDEDAITKQLIGFWLLPRLIELTRKYKETFGDQFSYDFDHAIDVARKLAQ